MDAAGNTTLRDERRSGQGPERAPSRKVERRVAQGEGGYVVDYVISNAGIDERGIPGRAHRVGGRPADRDRPVRPLSPGRHRRRRVGTRPQLHPQGRSVDAAAGHACSPPTTRWCAASRPGCRCASTSASSCRSRLIAGRRAAGRAGTGRSDLRRRQRAVAQRVPAGDRADRRPRCAEYGGGEVVISRQRRNARALAFDRADGGARPRCWRSCRPTSRKALSVSVRTDLDDADSTLVVGWAKAGRCSARCCSIPTSRRSSPSSLPLLDKLAADLEQRRAARSRSSATPIRAVPMPTTLALGMRRAKAVYEAIAAKLEPGGARQGARRVISNDPAAPAGTGK